MSKRILAPVSTIIRVPKTNRIPVFSRRIIKLYVYPLKKKIKCPFLKKMETKKLLNVAYKIMCIAQRKLKNKLHIVSSPDITGSISST